MKLLELLVERPGELVSRDDVRRRLWAPDVHVEFDTGLNQTVRRLREVLQDSGANPTFIATVPKQGYRFIAPVTVESKRTAWRSRLVVAGVLTAALVGALSLFESEVRAPAPSAHEAYLEGHFFLDKRSLDGFVAARDAFERAVAKDPDYAGGYRGLAETYAWMGMYDAMRPADAFAEATELSARALELDPDSPETHLLRAFVQHVFAWKPVDAERSFERALALNPNSARAHHWHGSFLSSRERHDEALAATRRALRLDPLSLAVRADLAWQLYFARRYDEAERECRRVIELDDRFLPAVDNLKWIAISDGRDADAFEAFLRVMILEGESEESLEQARSAFANGGLSAVLRWSLVDAEERADEPGQSAYDIAIDYAAVGDRARALAWLERAFEERETDLVDIRVDPRLDALRGEPAFDAIAARFE